MNWRFSQMMDDVFRAFNNAKYLHPLESSRKTQARYYSRNLLREDTLLITVGHSPTIEDKESNDIVVTDIGFGVIRVCTYSELLGRTQIDFTDPDMAVEHILKCWKRLNYRVSVNNMLLYKGFAN